MRMSKWILGLLILMLAVPLMGQRISRRYHVEALRFNQIHIDSLKVSDSTSILIVPPITLNGAISVDSIKAVDSTAITLADSVIVAGQLTVTGPLVGNALIAGDSAFGTTDAVDTLIIAGTTGSDIFVLTIKDGDPVADDLLGYSIATPDTLFVWRTAGTTSGLSYSWMRIKL